MSVPRLSTVWLELVESLRSASADRRVQTGWVAAQWAVRQTNLSHPAISAARIGGPDAEIAALASELDNQYLDFQDLSNAGKCSKEDVMTAFGRARAAKAVEYAVRGEAAEAVYEATICCDDVTGLRGEVTAALQ